MPEVERDSTDSTARAEVSPVETTQGPALVLFLLVFPGLVAVIACMSVIALGPTAFAIRRDFELSIAQIGFAYTAFFLASTLLTGIGGWLISRFSTLSIVRAGLLCSAALSATMAFATSAAFIIALSIAAGAVNGLITPSINVLITRLVPLRLRGLSFGFKVAAAPAASAIAALGAWTTANMHTQWQALFLANAGVGCAIVGGTLMLRKMGRSEVRRSGGGRPAVRLRARRPLILLAIGGLLAGSGTGVLPAFLVDGLVDHGLSPGSAAGLLALGGLLGFVSRVVVGGLSDRWPKPLAHLRAVAIMTVVAAASLAVLAVGGTEAVLIAATVTVFTVGWAWPGLIHYAVIATHPDTPAAATTYMQTGTFLGAVLGPFGFGLLAQHSSFAAAWGASSAVLLAAACFLAIGVRSLKRAPTASDACDR
jgi:MFS family permease